MRVRYAALAGPGGAASDRSGSLPHLVRIIAANGRPARGWPLVSAQGVAHPYLPSMITLVLRGVFPHLTEEFSVRTNVVPYAGVFSLKYTLIRNF